MYVAMMLITIANGAQPAKPSPAEQVARFVSPVACDFLTFLNAVGHISGEMIRCESESAPASALTAIAMAEIARTNIAEAERVRVKYSDPTDLSPVTTEVAEILDKCEAASRQIKTSKADVTRTVYNLVFETETVSEGELYFETPDKRSIDLRPSKGMQALRVAKNGRRFRLENGKRESWICLPGELVTADDEAKTFERLPTAGDTGIEYFRRWVTPPPFLFDAPSQQLRLEWNLVLRTRHADRVILSAVPRTHLLKWWYSECLILIDVETWHIKAVKHIDPSTNLETVYRFSKRTINESLPADCFDPALKWQGYTESKLD